jgi:hypothetical protein
VLDIGGILSGMKMVDPGLIRTGQSQSVLLPTEIVPHGFVGGIESANFQIARH